MGCLERGLPVTGMSDFTSKWARLAPNTNWTNLGLFKISIFFILGYQAKMNRKLLFFCSYYLNEPKWTENWSEKNLWFVPFGANLALFVIKSDSPGLVVMFDCACQSCSEKCQWNIYANYLLIALVKPI